MDNRVVPYNQDIYCPLTSLNGTYGYVYTGLKGPNECDQYHNLIGLDGLNFQSLGMQNEFFPCVYYTPGFDYAQSLYNPYNAYIPGAVIGTDTQFMGAQHMQTVPHFSYTPVMDQSRSDAIQNSHPDALYFNNGVGYSSALLPMGASAMPVKVSSDGGSQMLQMPNQSSQVDVLSITNPIKATLPANNGFLNEVTRPQTEYNGLLNKAPSEQKMGPRTNKTENRLQTPISLKAFTTNATNPKSAGNIVLNPNEYNMTDFSVDYPSAKFFVIKSYSEDDVHKSIKYNVWSSTINGNEKLDRAYQEAQKLSAGSQRKCPVFLFFSVNASGHFCGVAEMNGPVDFDKDMDFWLQDKWRGCFPVKWHIIKDVTNSSFRHIILVNNECRPVTSSRDTQEVPHLPGINMLTIFKNCPLKTCIFDDFSYYEERQRMMHEENSTMSTYLANGKEEINVESTDVLNCESNEDMESVEQMSSHANDNGTNGNDILTVGSMQINITDANRIISGILTIG